MSPKSSPRYLLLNNSFKELVHLPASVHLSNNLCLSSMSQIMLPKPKIIAFPQRSSTCTTAIAPYSQIIWSNLKLTSHTTDFYLSPKNNYIFLDPVLRP
ncbi:hypothetical protein DSUL_20256 [Desulfovibrionales bacterium]